MEQFVTIGNEISTQIVEKKSRFIADVCKVQNKEEAQRKLDQIRKKYFDAKHHCYAYVIIEQETRVEKFSDDKEPSGTAGAPILAVIRGKGLANVLVVVTRYFGGVLLGTGGLVKAYSEATQKALEIVTFPKMEWGKQIQLTLDYSELENIRYYCRKNKIKIVQENYFDKVKILIEISDKMLEIFVREIDNLKLKITKMEIIQHKFITTNT